MVDFSKPVNNGDMVRGLNHLVRHNQDLLAVLERVDSQAAEEVEPLKGMHQQHLKRLGDTIRALGGAPAQKGDWRRWAGESKLVAGRLGGRRSRLNAVHAEEGKLRDEYASKLEELKYSPEAVTLLRELVADEEGHLRQLEAVMERHH